MIFVQILSEVRPLIIVSLSILFWVSPSGYSPSLTSLRDLVWKSSRLMEPWNSFLSFHNHNQSIGFRQNVFFKKLKIPCNIVPVGFSDYFFLFPICPPIPFLFLWTNRWCSCTWLHCQQHWVDLWTEFPLSSSISWNVSSDHFHQSSPKLVPYQFQQGEPCISLTIWQGTMEIIHLLWMIYGVSRYHQCQCWQVWQLLVSLQVWQVWQLSLGLLLLWFCCDVMPGWCYSLPPGCWGWAEPGC